jgi:hypothetical protein
LDALVHETMRTVRKYEGMRTPAIKQSGWQLMAKRYKKFLTVMINDGVVRVTRTLDMIYMSTMPKMKDVV